VWCSLVTTAIAAAGLIATMALKPTPGLAWNHSASAAVGLYGIQRAGKIVVNDLVIVLPPEPVATFLAQGGYLPRGAPLLKRVRALGGQTVCRIGYEITIDGIEVGQALERDSRGRPLPEWQGGRVLADDEVFLMNAHPGSLDGR
jgi:type IV secretory pathway protease TraF